MARPCLVVAEDDAAMRKLLVLALTGAGYRVAAAPDGRAALALIRADPPDLVVTDLTMPEMDGASLARALQCLGLRPRVRLIVASAEGEGQEIAASVAADGYLAKPFRVAALLGLVRRLCAPEPDRQAG